MNKKCFKEFPVFETERLKLRTFAETDFHDYVRWHRGDVLYYMMGIHYIGEDDVEGFRRLFLKNAPRLFETKESAIWCIAEKASDISIGKIELYKFDTNANSAHIGYCLAENEREKGYMAEALVAVLKWAFECLNLNRVFAYVWEENNASANLLKKCGFTMEGILRENNVSKYTLDGRKIKENNYSDQRVYKNECVYGLLSSDYDRTK